MRLLGFVGIGLAPTKWLFLVGQGQPAVTSMELSRVNDFLISLWKL